MPGARSSQPWVAGPASARPRGSTTAAPPASLQRLLPPMRLPAMPPVCRLALLHEIRPWHLRPRRRLHLHRWNRDLLGPSTLHPHLLPSPRPLLSLPYECGYSLTAYVPQLPPRSLAVPWPPQAAPSVVRSRLASDGALRRHHWRRHSALPRCALPSRSERTGACFSFPQGKHWPATRSKPPQCDRNRQGTAAGSLSALNP